MLILCKLAKETTYEIESVLAWKTDRQESMRETGGWGRVLHHRDVNKRQGEREIKNIGKANYAT